MLAHANCGACGHTKVPAWTKTDCGACGPLSTSLLALLKSLQPRASLPSPCFSFLSNPVILARCSLGAPLVAPGPLYCPSLISSSLGTPYALFCWTSSICHFLCSGLFQKSLADHEGTTLSVYTGRRWILHPNFWQEPALPRYWDTHHQLLPNYQRTNMCYREA